MKMPFYRRVLSLTAASVFFLLATASMTFGQVDQGAITGTIQDSSGAVVSDAAVTLSSKDTGLELQTHSDSSGSYTFSPVKIGDLNLGYRLD